MKRNPIFKTLLVFICAASIANAQSISKTKVPLAVKSTFTKAHPKVIKVEWEMEKGSFEAGFTTNGTELSELYSKGGVLMESEAEVNVASLPSGILQYIKAHYKGAKVKDAAKIIKNNGEINYEAAINHLDLIFDSKENFLKEIKD